MNDSLMQRVWQVRESPKKNLKDSSGFLVIFPEIALNLTGTERLK